MSRARTEVFPLGHYGTQRLWGVVDRCGNVFPQSVRSTKAEAAAWRRGVVLQEGIRASLQGKPNPARGLRVIRFSVRP